MALECLIALTPIRAECRDFLVVPGTHQRSDAPAAAYLEWAAQSVACSPGGVVVFDPTLWHVEGRNETSATRVIVVEQFTRSFIKPHFDYVRALGEERVHGLPERLQQLLGWHTRLPTSLHELYLPPEDRFYRAGQE